MRTEGDELVRFGKRERLEQDRVDHAEDGGVRADPERESEDRDDGEARFFDELAQGVAKVVQHNAFDR